MALQTGSNFTISVIAENGTLLPVGHATSCSYSSSIAMEEATTKASNGSQEVIAGRASASLSVAGFQDYETITGSPAPHNTPAMALLHHDKTLIDWAFEDDVSGDTWSGNGFINDLELTTEADVTAGYSFGITRTGDTTFTAGS